MITAKPNIFELAKQGHPKAIETLLNRQLQPKGITAKVALKDNCLQIMLESAQIPPQQSLVTFITKGLTALKITSLKIAKVYGKQINQDTSAWSEEVFICNLEEEKLTENTNQLNPENLNKNTSNTLSNPNNDPEAAKKLVEESNRQSLFGCLTLLFAGWFLISMVGQCSSTSPEPDTSGCLGNYCWESQEQLERDICRVDPTIRGCR